MTSTGGLFTKSSILVTGSGSVWSNRDLRTSWNSSLVISNGGQVINRDAYVAYVNNGDSVRVADSGVWQSGTVYVGYQGTNASLVVAGGTVFAASLTIGAYSPACDNLVQLDSGSLIVTNATHDAVLEVRNGSFIQNGGVLQADGLVMTNACGLFVRNGGTQIIGTLVLDPNLSAVGDGIPNGWKQQYGLDPLDPNLANEDADGDGMSNLQEYLAGTDPTNSASFFSITAVAQEGNDVRVTWMTGMAGPTRCRRRPAILPEVIPTTLLIFLSLPTASARRPTIWTSARRPISRRGTIECGWCRSRRIACQQVGTGRLSRLGVHKKVHLGA